MAANEIVGQVGVRVVPDGANFTADLQRMLNGLGPSVGNATTGIERGMGRAQEAINETTRSVAALAEGFGGVKSAVAGVTAAFAAGEFAAKKLANWLGSVFDVTTKAQIGFTALIGDAGKAENLLTRVITLAKASPFETEPLIEASQRLLGVGMAAERIVPTLQHVGDLMSAMGGDPTRIEGVLYALTQIQTVGRLTGQDAMQLKNNLIPITKLLAESLGTTQAEIQKMQEQGKITADMTFKALDDAGIKVAGAMNEAVNTVSGSLSVLSDTIWGIYNTSPALSEIYGDVVSGVKGLADFLTSSRVTDAIEEINEGALSIYESLKPVLESLGDIGSSTTVTLLQTAGTALNVIATALDAIPEPVLKLLITGLIFNQSMSAIQRVSQLAGSIGNLASNILTTGKAAAIAGEQAEAAATKWSRYGQATASAAAAGAMLAGSMLAGHENQGVATAGSAMMMGGMGASIGQAFGPKGAIVGAAIGGTIGALQGYFGRSEEEARAHAERMKEIGTDTATGYLDSIATELGRGAGATALQEKMDELRTQIRASRDSIRLEDDGFGIRAVGMDDIPKLVAELDVLKAKYDETYSTITAGIANVTALLTPGSAAHTLLVGGDVAGVAGGAIGLASGPSFAEMEEGLRRYGLTLQDFATKTPAEIERIIERFDGLSAAQQNAAWAAQQLAASWKLAKEAQSALFANDIANLSSLISTERAIIALDGAIKESVLNPDNGIARMSADLAEMEALSAARSAAYAQTHAAAIEQGLSEETAARQANAAAARAAMGVTAEADRLRAQYAVEAADATMFAFQQEAMVRQQASERNAVNDEANVERLLRLAGVADTLDNRQIVINVALNGVEAAHAELARLRADAMNLMIWDFNEVIDNLIAQGEQQQIIDSLTGAAPATRPYSQWAVNGMMSGVGSQINGPAQAAAERAAEEAKREAERLAKEWEQAVEQSSNTLQSAIEGAMSSVQSAADAWKDTIRSSTQYEPATSTNRLLRNADRQVADLQEMQAGLGTLQAMGLSEAAIEALGLDGIEDVRQVRKLLRSDPAQIAALSTAVGTRDALANDIASERERTRTRTTITEAIVSAATILGYESFTPDQARAIAATFNITTATDADALVDYVLTTMSGGKISR